MAGDPASVQPPSDAGSDTVDRFHYQALLTIPFCVHAALSDEIIRVVPEHLEDVALQEASRWRFIQIKSRNPERGSWTLAQLLEDGGALRSLYRTYVLVRDQDVSLELLLEGALSHRNPINLLRRGQPHDSPEITQPVAESLDIDHGEAVAFLSTVTAADRPAGRREARALNLELLYSHAPDLTGLEIRAIYDRLVADIERAMRAEPLGPDWPTYVVHPDESPPEHVASVNAKSLTRERLRALLAPISQEPRPLLRRVTEAGSPSVSTLERKLRAGMADQQVLVDARSVHMQAIAHLERRSAATLYPSDARLEDLNQRLLIHANARRALQSGSDQPANRIWSDLLSVFSDTPNTIDPHSLLARDPMLLLGALCELSDRCEFDWGIVHGP